MECDECCKKMEKGTDIYDLDFYEFNNEFDRFIFCSEECALEFVKEEFKNDECHQLTDEEFKEHIYVRFMVG